MVSGVTEGGPLIRPVEPGKYRRIFSIPSGIARRYRIRWLHPFVQSVRSLLIKILHPSFATQYLRITKNDDIVRNGGHRQLLVLVP